MMNKTERIKTALNREKTDKLPYAFWTHMPGDDLDPEVISKKTYEFFKEYDLDFIKMMNNGMYSTEDFGCKADYSEIKQGGAAKLVYSPVKAADDWVKLKQPDVHQGAYGRELKHLRLLLELVNKEAPVIFTIFSPMTTANKISQNTLLKQITEGHGEQVHQALEMITETTCELVKAVMEAGADGIFMATQLASYDITTDKIYGEYGKPYDVRVFETANQCGGWFNLLHAHGNNIMFNLLKDYPSQAFNWHVFETLPGVTEARDITGKCLVGGIQRYNITDGKKNEIHHEIYTCIKELGGVGHILTPGCVIRYPLDKEVLSFVREAKESIEETMCI